MTEAHLAPGTVIEGRFVIERAISAGGMGEVYRGVDQETRMVVAIKRMLLQASEEDPDQVDPTGLSVQYHKERFMKEAQVLSNLDCPGVPRCVAHFYRDGRAYIVMEFIDGTDLEKEVRDLNQLAGVRMEPAKAVEYTIQVCQILEYLHALRPNAIVHRDVKPANIIVRHADNKIYLVDFGLARSLGGDTQTKSMVGTAGYAPIEQYHGKPEPASDQYALGVTLHYLLTGIPPVPFKIEPIRQARPGLPEELYQIVIKATQHESKKGYRYDDMRAMRQALEKVLPLLRERPPTPEEEPPPPEDSGGLGNLATERLGHSELAKAILAAKREKLSVHKEAAHEFDDFGHKDPLVDRTLMEGSFQAEAVRANRLSRGTETEEEPPEPKRSHLPAMVALAVLLVAGVGLWARHDYQSVQASVVQRVLPKWRVHQAAYLGGRDAGLELGVPAPGLASLWEKLVARDAAGLQADAPPGETYQVLNVTLEPQTDGTPLRVILSNSSDCAGYLIQARGKQWFVESLNAIPFPPPFEAVGGESSFQGKGRPANQPLLLRSPKGFSRITLLANRASAASTPKIRGLAPGHG